MAYNEIKKREILPESNKEIKKENNGKIFTQFEKSEKGFFTFVTGKFGIPDRNNKVQIKEGKPYFVKVLRDTQSKERKRGIHILEVEEIAWDNTPSRYLHYSFNIINEQLKLRNLLLKEEKILDPDDVKIKYTLKDETSNLLTISYEVFFQDKKVINDNIWILSSIYSEKDSTSYEKRIVSAIGKSDWALQAEKKCKELKEKTKREKQERENLVEKEMKKFPELKEINPRDLALAFLNSFPYYYERLKDDDMNLLMPFGGIGDHLISFGNYILRAEYDVDQSYLKLKSLMINQQNIEKESLEEWYPLL